MIPQDVDHKPFERGEKPSSPGFAARLNAGHALAEQVRDHVSRMERPGIALPSAIIDIFPAKIVAEGPAQEADYTDCRYWVRRVRVKPGTTATAKAETENDPTPGDALIVTATNKSEEAAGTHTLTADTEVMVLALVGSDKNQTPFYVFWQSLAGMISGKVTSDASGKGKYNGKSFTDRSTDVLGTGDLAESDFGTLSSTEDCLILNPVELGSSTTGHDVTATANTDKFAIYFTGRLSRVNSDGKKVVHAMLFYVGCAEGD
jgi:hypothetical protein